MESPHQLNVAVTVIVIVSFITPAEEFPEILLALTELPPMVGLALVLQTIPSVLAHMLFLMISGLLLSQIIPIPLLEIWQSEIIGSVPAVVFFNPMPA